MADIPTYFLVSTAYGEGDPNMRRFSSHHPWLTRLSYYDASSLSLAPGTKIVGMLSGAEAEIVNHTPPNLGRGTLYLDGGNISTTVGVPLLPPTHPGTFVVDAAGTPGLSFQASTRTITLQSGSWTNTPTQGQTIRVAGTTNNNGSWIVESATASTIVVHDRNRMIDEGLGGSWISGASITGYNEMQFIEGEHFADTTAPTTVLGRIGHQVSSRFQEFWRNWNEDAGSFFLQTHGEILLGGFNPALQGAYDQYIFRKNDRDSYQIVSQGTYGVHYFDSSIDKDSSVVVISASALVSFDGTLNRISLSSGTWTNTPEAGKRVIVAGSASNDGTYYVDAATSNTITVAEDGALTTESAGASITINEEDYGRWVVYHPHVQLTYDLQWSAGDAGDLNPLGLVGTSGSNHQNDYNGGLGWDVGIINWLKRKHAGEDFAVFKFNAPNAITKGDLQPGGQWRPGGTAYEQMRAMWERAWRDAKTIGAGILGEAAGNQWDVRGIFAWVGNSDVLKFTADLQAVATDVSAKASVWVTEMRSALGGQWNNGTQTNGGDDTVPFVFVKPHTRSYETSGLVAQSLIDSSWIIGGIKEAMLSVSAENFAAQSLRNAIDFAIDQEDNVLAVDINSIGEADAVFGMLTPGDSSVVSRAWYSTETVIADVPKLIARAYDVWDSTPVPAVAAAPVVPMFIALGQSQLGCFVSNEYIKWSLDSEYLITDFVDPAYSARAHATTSDYQMWNADKLVLENYDIILNTNTGQNITVIDGSTNVQVDGPTKTYSLTTGVWTNIPNPGAEIQVAGFDAGGGTNNGTKTVVSATNTTIVVSETCTTEAAGDTVSIFGAEEDPITNFGAGNFGPEAGLYPELFDALGLPIGLIKSAYASASLTIQGDPRGTSPASGVWDPDANNLYDRLLAQWAKLRAHLCGLGKTPDLQGIFFLQGFTDITKGVGRTEYRDALIRLIRRMRIDFATRSTGPYAPFCVMKSPDYYRNVQGVSSLNVDAIQAAQADAVASEPNTVLVESATLEGQLRASGVPLGNVDVHLDGESIIQAGRLFGQAWRTLVGT